MKITRFFNFVFLLTLLVLFAGCSSDDGDSNPTSSDNGDNPPAVSVEPITIPQKMQTAANNGDPGAAQATAYIQIANTLPSYSQLLVPPEGAGKVSSTSAVNGEWTWTDGGATITLTTSETATEYTWTVTIDGSYGGKTYSGQVVIEASEMKDGSSGELLFYDPDTSSPVVSFTWENLPDGTYHVNINSTSMSAGMVVDIYLHSDNSGYLDTSSSSGSWHVEWTADGSGTWMQYDANGNISNQGSWG